jgi:hypothetical protein
MLKRFHPETEIVDMTSTSFQMHIVDTLVSSEVEVSVVDCRAGSFAYTLRAFKDMGFLDAVSQGEIGFTVLHVIGPSIASLEEIREAAPYVQHANYYLVRNQINDTDLFDRDPSTHAKYFERISVTGGISIPKMNELACKQVETAGVPFSTFIANRTPNGEKAANSFVLRGYVRTWADKVAYEFSRIDLVKVALGREDQPDAGPPEAHPDQMVARQQF